MTTQHGDRANGDSFFTVEELEELIDVLEFVDAKFVHGRNDLIERLEKEKAYIEATKCKTIDC